MSMLAVMLMLAAPVQGARTSVERLDPGRDVGIDQHLGGDLPLELRFRDGAGVEHALGTWFGERPVVLVPVYYRCPMLCTLVLNGVLDALRTLRLDPGRDYELVVFSFDPREGPELAAAKRTAFLRALGREGADAGVHFLTAEEPAIGALTRAIGFRYVEDPETGQLAHAGGIVVATPGGTLSRYMYGVEFPPRDLRLGLVEASQGTVGSLADQVLLLCYAYDPTTGRYGFAILAALRTAGVMTVVVLGLFVLRALRHERRPPVAAADEEARV